MAPSYRLLSMKHLATVLLLAALAMGLALPASTTVAAATDDLVKACSVNDNGKALLDCAKGINGTHIGDKGCCIRLWSGISSLTFGEADECVCGIRKMVADKDISIESLRGANNTPTIVEACKPLDDVRNAADPCTKMFLKQAHNMGITVDEARACGQVANTCAATCQKQ